MTERTMKLYRSALERLTSAAFQPGSVSFASVPARPEEDADTLLAFALDDLERMRRERDTCTTQECEELRQVRAQNAELLEALDHPVLRELLGALEDGAGGASNDELWGLAHSWMDVRDTAIAKAKGGAV